MLKVSNFSGSQRAIWTIICNVPLFIIIINKIKTFGICNCHQQKLEYILNIDFRLKQQVAINRHLVKLLSVYYWLYCNQHRAPPEVCLCYFDLWLRRLRLLFIVIMNEFARHSVITLNHVSFIRRDSFKRILANERD